MFVLSRLELYNRDQKDKEKYLLRVQGENKNVVSRIRDCPVD